MAGYRTFGMAIVGFVLVVLMGAAGAEPDPDVVFAESALKAAGHGTDGPALVAFLRSRTLSAADQERLPQLVRDLGDDAFATREKASEDLVRAGRAALPYLKLALNDPDLEVVRRAERCLEGIEFGKSTSLVLAVARLLADRKPPEAAEVILGYLPYAQEDIVEETLLATLRVVGVRDGKPDPTLAAAVADRIALRRAAAAHVLGRSERAEERKPVLRLLADADARVRYEAAAALASAGERSALPALVALLDGTSLELAWQSEEILCRLAGDQAPAVSLGSGSAAERRHCHDAWDTWLKTSGEKADLARLKQDEPPRGLTLVCEYDGATGGGRVCELSKDGKVRWEVSGLQGPNDVQLLSGGRVLVAERNGGKVSERDRKGNIVWQFPTSSPIACQRLPNGNTLVATFNDLFEVSPAAKVVHTHSHTSGFRHALRMRNGHILYVASNGEVGELDAAWKPVRTIKPAAAGSGAGYWASVEPLPGGRFLVVYGGSNKVVELDGTGQIVWECTQPSPVYATRLRNGNTLVACFEARALVEVNRDGKEIAKQTLPGRPFTVKRY